MRRIALALIVAAACASPAQAQVYRWVDKDGKVHYSDQKPKDAVAKEMAIQSQPSDAEAAEKAMAELKAQNQGLDQLEADRKQAAADQQRVKQQQDAQCKAARSEAQLLTQVNRYFTVDDKGERRYDSDAQLAQRRAAANAKVAELCR